MSDKSKLKEKLNDNKSPVEKLISYQIPHLYQLQEALQNSQCVLDGSDTGTGKTYVGLALCSVLKLKPFIVCPKSVISSWVDVADTMGVEILGLANYEKLKGGKYYTPNYEIVECPYMDKVVAGEEKEKKKKEKKPLTKNMESQAEIDSISLQLKLIREKMSVDYKNHMEETLSNKIIKHEKEYGTEDKDGIGDKDDVNDANDTNYNDSSGSKVTSTTLGKKKKEKMDYIFQFPQDTIIIVDEAHKCKNYKTSNSVMLLGLKDSGMKMLMLSATITDKIDCFKPFGVVFGFYNDIKKYKMWIRSKLKPKKDFKKKLSKFQLNSQGKGSKHVKPTKEEIKTSDDDEVLRIIHSNIYPGNGSRMKIKELGELFPKNQIVARCYYSDDHNKVNEIYNLINSALLDIKTKEKRSYALGEIIRCRMRLEMLKLPIILDLVDEGLENGKSIAIFVNFRDSMDYLQHHLKEDCSLIHGTQTLEERVFAIEQFQTNKTKIIIAIMQAGGVGISLHDLYGRPRMSIISPSWNGIDLQQCLGRIHRAGSKSPALQRIVYIAKSYEEEICNLIGEKLKVMSSINDGDLIGPKINKEKLKEIGDLDKINYNVVNLEGEDEFIEKKKQCVNKGKKEKKKVKRKKYIIVDDDNDDDKKKQKEKKPYLDTEEADPFALLDPKYKAK